jgi:hypothetical protein
MNRGFPTFGRMNNGRLVEVLKNYTLPDFILKLVAKTCNSKFLEKGRYYDKLQSLNDESLELLHKIFVKCENDDSGKFDVYRFYVYVSSLYPKCEILINQTIHGLEKKHKVTLVKNNGMIIAIAENKSTGNPINKQEIKKFFDKIIDIKNGEHGTMVTDAIFCSSVGFRDDALVELESLKESRCIDPENLIYFKTVNFENNMYSIVKI